jgi:cytoskeleton protein RodZ
MSDEAGAAAPTAGRLLREAREKQGLHIAALAAAIKVPQKKLELLEADRFEALLDATFARALAQTVCRALKIDPGPVMALLPPPAGHRLADVGEGLNTPFRDRPGVLAQRDFRQLATSPAFWLTALVLLAATFVYFLPAGLTGLAGVRGRQASAPAAVPAEVGVASAPVQSASLPASEPPQPAAAASETSAPGVAAGPATAPASSSPEASAQPTGVLQLRSSAPSWVEVVDGRGDVLISRVLHAGEAVGVDGPAPLRVKIGNAAATQLSYRGQVTDLQASTQSNVARLELR